MKNIKRVMCSGLAFEDQEDMEILHQYALEGWIFREFKGVWYVLHKEEPQDLIFSYDCCKVSREDESEYYEVFKEMGWEPIQCKDKQMHFFSAKSGTVPIHTDSQIQAKQFQEMTKWSLIMLVGSVIVLILSSRLNHLEGVYGTIQSIILLSSAALIGGSGMCFIGCFLRTKNKRLAFNLSLKSSMIAVISCLLIAIGVHLGAELVSEPIANIFNMIQGLSVGLITGIVLMVICRYPLYRDKKVK